MAWRFKASKYKNAAPLDPKLDSHIRDLSIGSYHSCGNYIAASAAFIAFNWDSLGCSLAVLPLNTTGRPDKAGVPRLDGHSQLVTDFTFSPFDDGLLATGSQDQTIKLWRIPRAGLTTNLVTPELSLQQHRRVETLAFHPAAEGLLTSSCHTNINIWDITTGQQLWGWGQHGDQVQATGWQDDGGLLASQCKDRRLRVFDPRAGEAPVHDVASHEGMKDSKLVWVGEQRILTTGFGGDRCRELMLRDIRNIKTPQKSLSLDVSSGILVPLYDRDTKMVFLAGKGDRYIQFVEVADKEPWFVEGLRHTGEQIKGSCLVPKRALDVMSGEVNRVLQLANTSIIPISWQVPRKSYREFHSDIYPDTPGTRASMGPADWLAGGNIAPVRISLNPAKREADLTRFGPSLKEMPQNITPPPVTVVTSNGSKSVTNGTSTTHGSKSVTNGTPSVTSNMDISPRPSPRPRVVRSHSEVTPVQPPTPAPRPTSMMAPPPPRSDPDEPDNLRRQPSIRDRMKMFESLGTGEKTTGPAVPTVRGERELDMEEENKENTPVIMETADPAESLRAKVRSDKSEPFLLPQVRPQHTGSPNLSNNRLNKFGRLTKFKHMKGTPMHKSMHFENLKNLSKSMAADCDVIHVNPERLVVPLSGPGGKLAVFEVAKSGRIPDGVIPAVINTATVMDFAWDPFNNNRLGVVTDDGAINLWNIPDGGLLSQVNEPTMRFQAHGEKVNIIKFNPIASDIVATSGFDFLIKIWNLSESCKEVAVLEGHREQVYSLSWSQCGRYLATVCRDGRVRIYDPRGSSRPVREGGNIVAKKGARVVWACEGKYLLVTGFSAQSERQVMIYQSKDLACVHTETMDVSPAILIPFYDEDSSTLFLSGKGETTVYGYEIAEDAPHMFPLSPYKTNIPSQGLAFIPHKNCLNVREVEFARAYRLSLTTITPISFTVPRIKSTYFQDDIFPPTRELWAPAVTGEGWARGEETQPAWLSLKPPGMSSVSQQSCGQTGRTTKANIINTKQPEPEAKDLGRDLTKAVSRILSTNETLEQDNMEGVEDKDWESED